ncbi:MAG TPA: DUF1893 domain-containing protein [Dehalococcoidia bacterium]
MYKSLFDQFVTSSHTLRVYKSDKIIFSSEKDRLLPLVEYLDKFGSRHRKIVIFDRILGRAAALLCVKANCQEVYSPLGSQLAIGILGKRGIKYHFSRTVPCILRPDSTEMCPMELLSIGKDPDEFYRLIKLKIAENAARGS